MRFFNTISATIFVFFLTACSTPVGDMGSMFNQNAGGNGLVNYTFKIPNSQINSALSRGFPVSRSTAFGTFLVKQARLAPSIRSDQIMLDVGTSLSLFNTKNIDSNMKVAAGLRYEPSTRQIFLKNIMPIDMKVGSTSVSSYVPQSVIDIAGQIVSQRLGEIPVYELKDNITAKFIKNIEIQDGNIAVKYGI